MTIVSLKYCVSKMDMSCVTRTRTSATLSFGVPSEYGGGRRLDDNASISYTCKTFIVRDHIVAPIYNEPAFHVPLSCGVTWGEIDRTSLCQISIIELFILAICHIIHSSSFLHSLCT